MVAMQLCWCGGGNMKEKYRPSSGCEGMWFTETYCMNCIHCDPDPDGDKQCQILCSSMCYDVDDPKYPKEWIYGDDGTPKCTQFVKWDWGNDGDPDDPSNPKAPIPDDPNQLVLPFIIDEILSEVPCRRNKDNELRQILR
jgi:hypothetical protein